MVTDVPSWAKGERTLPGETPTQATERVFREHGKTIGKVGPGSEYSEVLKYLARRL